MNYPRLAWFLLLWALVSTANLAAAEAAKLTVFILAGQSNMEGQAVVDLDGKEYNGGKGTLTYLLKDPAKAALVRHLRSAQGTWAVRESVWVRYQPERGPLQAGPLTVGYTPYADKHHFGPELQFGHVIGDHCGGQVLLIKTAWGGKSLYKDFRPPSSGGAVGPYYTKMLAEIRTALANLKQDFPKYDGRGYELAGFVWYQGWNDGVDPKRAVPEYEQNLVNLIKDVRKDLKAPNLPVVIGELTGPWVEAPGAWKTLRQAQAAAAARPEFTGTVLFAPTHDFVRKPEDSPNPGHGHHEFGNAETYFLVGDALGKGMRELLQKDADRKATEPPKPTAHIERQLEGWTVRVDARLLQPPNDELGRRALRFLENKLTDIKAVVPADRVRRLQAVPIVLDLTHGHLRSMQYHPSAGWLRAHGYAAELAKCVHIPRAADLPTKRNINEQPWVILHELAHAYHDQVLGFDEPRIRAAYEHYKKSDRGEKTLLFNGQRVRHYALTDHKEFFAEMTEAYFGVNDFFPFNRAELKEAEPEIDALLHDIWESAAAAHSGKPPDQPTAPDASPAQAMLSVADFLPKGYVTDGSVSYQREIQQAIDRAARDGRPLVFPAMTYRLDEAGLQLRSRSTMWLYGAVFRFDAHCTKAGHAFAGHDVSDVQLLGGEVVGRNDAWPAGVGIRGVHVTGQSKNIRIRDMRLRDLSSNGIGIFGTAEQPIRDVWITDVVIENCCNRYGDYLSERPGPEKGSKREDQGLIACYHVEDFVVRGCRLEKSRSDGTHFYRCRRGQVLGNKVYAAQMGGYFVESCDDILAADNLIRANGSRGCTIERGSKNCTLKGCIVAGSGREGLWAPDCTGLVVTGNIFDGNGRKPNGKESHQVWNANITVNHDPHDPTKSPTRDYLIAHNILYTTADQVAAIRIDTNQGTTGIVVKDNLLRGENRQVRVEGAGRQGVIVRGNE